MFNKAQLVLMLPFMLSYGFFHWVKMYFSLLRHFSHPYLQCTWILPHSPITLLFFCNLTFSNSAIFLFTGPRPSGAHFTNICNYIVPMLSQRSARKLYLLHQLYHVSFYLYSGTNTPRLKHETQWMKRQINVLQSQLNTQYHTTTFYFFLNTLFNSLSSDSITIPRWQHSSQILNSIPTSFALGSYLHDNSSRKSRPLKRKKNELHYSSHHHVVYVFLFTSYVSKVFFFLYEIRASIFTLYSTPFCFLWILISLHMPSPSYNFIYLFSVFNKFLFLKNFRFTEKLGRYYSVPMYSTPNFLYY